MSLLKNQIEISKMRKTGKLVNQVIHETAKSIRPGITTSELEDVAVMLMEERGLTSPCLGYAPAKHPPFPAWTCISVNEEIVHAVPGRRALKEGDLVTIDVCAEHGGWVAMVEERGLVRQVIARDRSRARDRPPERAAIGAAPEVRIDARQRSASYTLI